MLPTPYPPLSIPLLHAKQYSKLTKTSNNVEYHVPKNSPPSSDHACQPDAHQNQNLEIF
jgi:hypothetical protein